MQLNDVTIAGNSAGERALAPGGGGVANKKPATLTVANSIIAGNRDVGAKAPDCLGKLLSAGYNLVQSTDGCTVRGTMTGNVTDKDPKLGPLAEQRRSDRRPWPCSPAAPPSTPATPPSPAAAAAPASSPTSAAPRGR